MMMMISDLPNDLEAEILARVPEKSLQELKTTCKRWYALFRDPKFVEKNQKMSKAARESMLLTRFIQSTEISMDFTTAASNYVSSSPVNVASFLLDEEKKVAVCCETCDENMKGEDKNRRIYIVGEDMYNDDTVNASLLSCPLVLTHVPTLFHIH